MCVEIVQALSKLSTKSKIIIAKNSGYYIQIDEPELIVEAIGEMINENN